MDASCASMSSSSSSSSVGSTSENIVVISQGSLMVIFCAFAASLSVTRSQVGHGAQWERNSPSAPSSRFSTSTPPPPPSPPESFACFRTSFHERYVLRRFTFARSCRIRKMRSSAERYRAPRRVASARAWRIYRAQSEPAHETEQRRTDKFNKLAADDVLDEVDGLSIRLLDLAEDEHHLGYLLRVLVLSVGGAV